jgi:hypothetical protein
MLCCRLQLSVEAQVVASLASAVSTLYLAFAVECPVLAVLLSLDGERDSDRVSVFCRIRSLQSSPPQLSYRVHFPASECFGD